MDKIKDKKELYRIINQETNDNIDIIAYVSRDKSGNILEEHIDNNFYHDIFLLKGIASNINHGVKEQNRDKIDFTDFWVLNTSKYPVWIKSHSKNIEDIELGGNSVKFIKTKNHLNFNKKDIYFEFNNQKVYPTQIEEKG